MRVSSDDLYLKVLDLETFMINASDAEYDFVDDMKRIGLKYSDYSEEQKDKIEKLHYRFVKSRGLS